MFVKLPYRSELIVMLVLVMFLGLLPQEAFTSTLLPNTSTTILNQNRDHKLLSPLTIIQFANSECQQDDWTGTCYSKWDCYRGFWGQETQISADTPCTNGLGRCCVGKIGCDAQSSNNNTWLTSPGFGGTFDYALDCKQTITIDNTICQLRLEIKDLSLYYPNSYGICDTDWLTVNHDVKFDKLCGITYDNHFYIDVDANTNTNVEFAFHTDSSVSLDRSWAIRVSKIMCHSEEEAPRGCGQYYMGTTGDIKALNYNAPNANKYIFDSLNYAICVRMELGYCKNTYTENKNSGDGWLTKCPDIFERPGRPDDINLAKELKKCMPLDGTTDYPQIYTISYLTPHLFLLDTTQSSTNTHHNGESTNNKGVYDISYSQTAC